MHRRTLLAATAAALTSPATLRAADTPRDDGPVRMRHLYEKDMSFTPLAEELAGERLEMRGFMAPPLKADARFFVLTKRPMAVCPFCEDEASWPRDIVAVYTKRSLDVVPFNVPIIVSGELQLGTSRDPETGFVSRVRIADATFDRI